MEPRMNPRSLLVTADDFGIGMETSCGILDLAAIGVVTSTVLLVNSPHAADSVRLWLAQGQPLELGWHPCLTLDSPLTPPDKVRSLVDGAGRFLHLGTFLKKMLLGQIVEAEIETELRAQYERFLELVGQVPMNVNGHHHVHIFGPVRRALSRILRDQHPRPYVRRVVETSRTLFRVRGARRKRMLLSRFGGRAIRHQAEAGWPGNDALIGITDPQHVHNANFLPNWIANAKGNCVELTCHPGYLDSSIEGRDGSFADGQLHRRAAEWERLRDPTFRAAVHAAGFAFATAAELAGKLPRGLDRLGRFRLHAWR